MRAGSAACAGFTVRLARDEDLEAVAGVEAASFDHDPWTVSRLRGLLCRGAAWLLVAIQPTRELGGGEVGSCEGDVVGHCLVQVIVDEAEVLSIATVPWARGRGVGRALLAALEARGEDEGVRTIFLDVSDRNAAARRLYAAAGYRVVGRRPSYYADGADGLIMRRDLPPATPAPPPPAPDPE